MSRLLRVNMTDRTTTYEEVPEHYRHWGGRGLTSMVIAREVPPTCHPLGPNNKLVIAPGIVSGTAAPTSCSSWVRRRWCSPPPRSRC